MTRKFKVGDKVRIKSFEERAKYEERYLPGTFRYDEIYTVGKIGSNGGGPWIDCIEDSCAGGGWHEYKFNFAIASTKKDIERLLG